MLSRFLSIVIVLFWITMTGLLVRNEWWPDHSRLRVIPMEHVARLLWLHEQSSDLTIWNDGQRLGHLTLHPRRGEADDMRLLDYSGNLQLRLPGSNKQRISWDGTVELDKKWEMQSLLLGVGVREPSQMRAELLVRPRANSAHYRLLNAGRELQSEDFTLDEAGMKKMMELLEIDPIMVQTFRPSQPAAPVFTAEQSSLTLHGEKIDTYLLSMQQSGQTLFELHISQLGQVLQVKTLVGYSMVPEDLTP